MQTNEQRRFDRQYQKHLTALKLRNMSASAQDVYARAVRRVSVAYDCCPDRLSPDDLRDHFAALIDSHSWSTVRSDRAGLQFFFKPGRAGMLSRSPWIGVPSLNPNGFNPCPM